MPIEYAGSDAQVLPAGDRSVDSVLSTWTLCTIPDAARALAEIVRVLRPGLEVTRLDTYYMAEPRALGYTFEGVAVRS